MRLSNLFWIVSVLVALFIVLCAGRTRQRPRMIGKREKRPLKDYECVAAGADEQLKLDSWDATEGGGYQWSTSCDQVPLPSPPTPPTTICQTPSPPTPSSNIDCNQMQQQQLPQQEQQQQQQGPQYPQQQDPYWQQQQQSSLPAESDDSEQRAKELRKLVQHLYVAQARVQLEATEIHKAQAVASSAQSQLEDSANHVRTITATLHNAQQEVAAAAIRAQIAQLQLAAHDQLLFAARQDVDALSSQVVGLQAAEGIVQPKLTVDLHALLDKLRQPLQHFDRPTPVPMIITLPPYNEASPGPAPESVGSSGVGSSKDIEKIVSDKEHSPIAQNRDYT